MISRQSFKYPEDIDTWKRLYQADPARPPADRWLYDVLVEYQRFSDEYYRVYSQ